MNKQLLYNLNKHKTTKDTKMHISDVWTQTLNRDWYMKTHINQ